MIDTSARPDRPGASVPLPAMKTAVPQVNASQVSRPRLTSRLAGLAEGQVGLLSAPAGHGKTMLLAEWAPSVADRIAWVSLDSDDNDDRRFWSAILTALRACGSVAGQRTLALPELPRHPSADATFMASLIDALSCLPVPVHLVLDDVHELTAAEPLHGLGTLIRYAPQGLRLILATRSDPPLQLSKLRLAEQLLEVRADDLAFSDAETESLLATAGLDPRPDRVRVLLEQTGGWAAGVRLAALSMQASVDPDEFLADLVGNSHAISDYLVREVLSRLDRGNRDLLEAVCICDRLNAPLAEAVSGSSDAGAMLTRLESETSLLVSHGDGRRWFRIHPLLRSHLLVDLRRRSPELVSALNLRAAAWFEQTGNPARALDYAGRAGVAVEVAALLTRNILGLVSAGRHAVIREALKECSEDDIAASPLLTLGGALAFLEVGDVDASDRMIKQMGSAWPTEPSRDLVWLDLLVGTRRRWLVDNVPDGMTQEARAVSAPGADAGAVGDRDSQMITKLAKASAAAATGSGVETRQRAQEVVDLAVASGNDYLAARGTALLAIAAALEGDITGLAVMAERAKELAPSDLWHGTQNEMMLAIFQGYAALLDGRPRDCVETVRPATMFRTVSGSHVQSTTATTAIDLLMAAGDYDRGDRSTGLESLRRVRLAADPQRTITQLIALLAVLEHEAATELARSSQTHEVMEWAEQHLPGTGELHYLRARGPATISRFDAAREHLKPLLDGTAKPVLRWVTAAGWVLECMITLHSGQREHAREALRNALVHAAEAGTVRPLIRAPAEVRELLAEQLGSFGEYESTARRALTNHGLNAPNVALRLTGREQQVLRLLPSLRSLDEIALDLTVSLNTIKTHVRAIYAKLGVTSRRRAVEVALGEGLISAAAASPSGHGPTRH